MTINRRDKRLINEIQFGQYVAKKGEYILKWSSPASQVRLKRRANLFKKFIGHNHRVLELGCGTGLFTQELAKTKNQIYAIDISSSLIQQAKKRVKAKNVHFKLDNAYNTNFKNTFFDYIVGSSILHHLDIDRAVKEIFRLLKPGGQFIFTEPNLLNPQIALERSSPFMRRLFNNSPDETAFIKWSIKNKLLKIGFTHVQVKPFDFLHPATPTFLINLVNQASKLFESMPIIKEIAGSLIITGKKL